ncbi:MAG: SDR family oxidoreductase [Candidatus Aenigmarchaeota archaeon]|nr:SDR family oxidoreductase [Candidatus Aenigmarchaeota archaeon]
MRLKGRVAVVTGGGRGIGRATAVALAKEGAGIVIVSRTRDELAATAALVKRQGAKCIGVVADVSKPVSVKKLFDRVIADFGRVDILVNNAGVAYYKPMVNTSEKEWDETVNTNLKGVFLCSKEALPYLVKNRGGVIVNISSWAGKHGMENFAAYSASKFGVVGLTASLAEEMQRKNVRVYAVCPGGVNTKMFNDLFPEVDASKLLEPGDVARKIIQLCLPECKVNTGTAVDIHSLY